MHPPMFTRRHRFAAFLVAAAMLFSAPAWSADADDALVEAAKKEGKLVFYTSTPEAPATAFLQAFAKRYPFIDVSEFYRATSGRVKARLDAELEAQHYSADVFSNADTQTFTDLKERKELANFTPAELDKYGPAFKDPGYWAMWAVSPIMMAYNPTTMTGDVPTSWAALTEPRFQGRIGFEDASSGTQFLQWYALRQVMGPDYWGRVAVNRPHLFAGIVPITDGVLRGELLIAGETFGYQYVDAARKKAPFMPIYPTEGVPLNTSCMGVLAHAPHPNAARLFMNWALSLEGQSTVVQILGYNSARDDAPTPPGLPKLSELKLILVDRDKMAESRDDYAKDWRRLATGGP